MKYEINITRRTRHNHWRFNVAQVLFSHIYRCIADSALMPKYFQFIHFYAICKSGKQKVITKRKMS